MKLISSKRGIIITIFSFFTLVSLANGYSYEEEKIVIDNFTFTPFLTNIKANELILVAQTDPSSQISTSKTESDIAVPLGERLKAMDEASQNNGKIKPGKTYLSDVSHLKTGRYETIVTDGNNEEVKKQEDSESRKKIITVLAVSIVVVGSGYIFFVLWEGKKEKNIRDNGKANPKSAKTSQIITELEKIQNLKQEGVINKKEYKKLKKLILNDILPPENL